MLLYSDAGVNPNPDAGQLADIAILAARFWARFLGSPPRVALLPAQQKPYPTLSEAAANQSVYVYNNTTGWIAGCYLPVFFEGLNVVGYHLHFISYDRQTGGHILDFTVPEGMVVEYDITPEFTMILPTSGDFTTVDLSQDMSEQLAEIEN